MEELLQVGVISNTHGVRGQVKVFPTTDDPARFKDLKEVLLETGKGTIPLEITQVNFFKNLVILKFKDYDNMDDVLAWKGKPLLIPRDQAVECQEDEYFIADLLDLAVVLEDGSPLGTLADVLVTGANDVYVIKRPGKKDLLLPAIRECILDVDLEAGQMQVHLLPGLLDEE